MNVIMLYPKCSDTYYRFNISSRFLLKKTDTPIEIKKVSALLPHWWTKKIIDLNINKIKDIDFEWADYIILSGISNQKDNVDVVLKYLEKFSAKIIAVGSLFAQNYTSYPQIDYFILNETDITFPLFLDDLFKGNVQHIYQASEHSDLSIV